MFQDSNFFVLGSLFSLSFFAFLSGFSVFMVDMDGFRAGGHVGGTPNTEDLGQLGNAPTGLLHLLGFNFVFIFA